MLKLLTQTLIISSLDCKNEKVKNVVRTKVKEFMPRAEAIKAFLVKQKGDKMPLEYNRLPENHNNTNTEATNSNNNNNSKTGKHER